MKHMMKKVLALVLGAVLCMGVLAGCGSSFDAGNLVQGNLDLVYLNKYTDSYLKSVSMTKDAADAEYASGIAIEVDYFIEYFYIEMDYCDPSVKDQITELYHQIYDHSKYEVGEVTKSGDTYLVELTVYPIDTIKKIVDEDWETFCTEWTNEMTEKVNNGEVDAEDDVAIETAWAQGVIDLVKARAAAIGYLEPQTISVQVVQDADGIYSIDSNDFSRIDSLIIAY